MNHLCMTFPPDLEQATWAAAAVKGITSLWVDDDLKIYQVELAAAEAINNAASYSQGPVQVDVTKTGKGLWLRIWSEGEPLEVDLENLDDPRNFDVSDMDTIDIRGRGFFILQQITSDLSLRYQDGRNCLSFCIPLG